MGTTQKLIRRMQTALILPILNVATTTFAQAPEFAAARIDQQLGTTSLTWGTAISEDGDAVGYAFVNDVTRAYIYSFEHGAVLLPAIEGSETARAVDITDRDGAGSVIIVGDAGFSSLDPTNPNGTQAVFWRYSVTNGVVLDSGVIGVLPGADHSFISAANNNGLAVGFSGGALSSPMVYDFNTSQLASFVFPATPTTINNNNQVAGGQWIGDLSGNSTNIGKPNESTSASIRELTDNGQAVAGVSMPFTDGAGAFVNGAAIFNGEWSLLWANSRFDGATGTNRHGDVVGLLGVTAAIRPVLYVAGQQLFLINDLMTPSQPLSFSGVDDVNDKRQIITSHPAAVLTPLGSMIIPGDVNGDADIQLDDLCAYLAAPIDLDGDGDADADDDQWLIDRLAVFSLVPHDCNGNGWPDACDIDASTSTDCNSDGIPDDCQADCDSDGVPDDCESDCNLNSIPDDCDIAAGSSEDCNENGIPDECDGSDLASMTQTYAPPQFLIADSTFTDSILVPNTGTIADVDFTLNLDYRIGNLLVRLTHAGITVVLVDQPGYPTIPQGNGQLGYRITLDDEGIGPNIEDVGNFGSPFEPIESPPSYKPHQPLSAFDGLPRDGNWTIEVVTIGQGATFDPKITSWGLSILDEAVAVGICDCNDNGIEDVIDIASGASADENTNGIPDECENIMLLGDVDGDGTLNMNDIMPFVAVVIGEDNDPSHVTAGDMNMDSVCNGRDIQLFMDALHGS